jgi:hypothetical protein
MCSALLKAEPELDVKCDLKARTFPQYIRPVSPLVVIFICRNTWIVIMVLNGKRAKYAAIGKLEPCLDDKRNRNVLEQKMVLAFYSSLSIIFRTNHESMR